MKKKMEFLPYYCKRTDARLDRIEKKLDSLITFKGKIIGYVSAIGFIAGLIATFLQRMF